MALNTVLILLCIHASLAKGREGELTGKLVEKHARKGLREGLEDFTQSIYLHMASKQDGANFVFSPLSIHSALSMLYLGTKHFSESSEELAKALGVINNRALLRTGYKNVVDTYRNESNFLYANNFWLQESFAVKPKFRTVVETSMNSGIDSIDFGALDSVERVNGWVSNKTNGKITDLVDSFSSDTSLFLANALFFKESWEVPFLAMNPITGEEVEGEFQLAGGKRLRVPMMEQRSSKIGYKNINMKGLRAEFVTIPYENSLFEMQIILPKSEQEMRTIESHMVLGKQQDLTRNSPSYFNIFSQKSRVDPEDLVDDVLLKMPTFQIKTDMNAVEPLQELGVNKVGNNLEERIRRTPWDLIS